MMPIQAIKIYFFHVAELQYSLIFAFIDPKLFSSVKESFISVFQEQYTKDSAYKKSNPHIY